MPARIELLPIEADEFMSEIQTQIDASESSAARRTCAVQFFPPLSLDNSSEHIPVVPSEENFCERDYLFSNPDIAAVVGQGEFRSGFEHWASLGKQEGRSFQPIEFNEFEYLELNPDVARAVKDGQFASGRDHWQRCGRLEGRSIGRLMPRVLTHLKRLGSEMQVRVSQIGEAPQNPGTLRGAIGRRAILILRRFLWWHTQSVAAFANVVTRGLRQQVEFLEHLGNAQEQNHRTLQAVHQAVTSVESHLEESVTEQRQLASRTGQLEAELCAARELNTVLLAELRVLSAQVSDLHERLNRAEVHQSERIGGFDEVLASEREARKALAGRLETTIEEYHGLRDQWNAQKHEVEWAKAELAVQGERVTTLLVEATPDHKLDALYLAFEDTFRGPREEVKRRQSVYLPFLSEAQAGTPEAPVLDLGCGRGEWLELLRDQRLIARGLDRNVAMIAQCRSLALDVKEGDALAYLRTLSDGSLGAITSFHMIEHIPFDSVVALLGESARVLRPGGLLILETPNPKNLLVASHNFYLDPSHLKPLPPEMLRFFVEARGFSNCQVLELQPGPVPADGVNAPACKCLNDLLYGPRDYGLIAWRP